MWRCGTRNTKGRRHKPRPDKEGHPMKLSEVIERLQKELEQCGDMEVDAIDVPHVEDGEVLDLVYT